MKKNKIYVNKINKNLNNNQKSFDIREDKVIDIKEEYMQDDKLSVSEKIDKLFNTNGYVFNTNVKIITNNKTYDTRIANKVGDNIITLDNDVISILDIKDIIF